MGSILPSNIHFTLFYSVLEGATVENSVIFVVDQEIEFELDYLFLRYCSFSILNVFLEVFSRCSKLSLDAELISFHFQWR